MQLISDSNLKRIDDINDLLKSNGMSKLLTFKDVVTAETIGVVMAIPSFFDETKDSFIMTFQENFVISSDSCQTMVDNMNQEIEDFLKFLNKEYLKLIRLNDSFIPIPEINIIFN